MFNLREYRRNPEKLSELLPWAALIEDGVVLNKDGSFLSTLAYRGPDLDSATQEELIVASSHLNNILRRFGSGWALFFESQRSEITIYPNSEWEYPLPYLIDIARQEVFEKTPHYFSNYYLSFVYLPPTDSSKRILSQFIHDKGSSSHGYERHMEEFQQKVARASDLIARQFTEVKILKSDDLLTYLHSTISLNRHSVRTPETPMYLDSILTDSALTTGTEPKLGDEYLGVVGVLGYPGTSQPGMLDALNHLSFPIRWTSRFLPLDREEARKELEEYKRKWFAKRKSINSLLKELLTKEETLLTDSDAIHKAQDVDEALLELGAEHVSYGFFTSNIVVTDKDRETLVTKLRSIEQIVNGCGFVTKRENFNAVEAWLGTIPGNTRPNVRRPLLNSLNVTHLFPGASSDWAGQLQNRYLKAPPVFVAETNGSTPFYFSHHVEDVGHTMVLGPTGAGKSTFLNFLAVQFLRYDRSQIFIFDKGRSAETMTLGVGGDFFELAGETHLSFQPLRDIHQDEERSWAHEWVLQLVEAEGVTLNPQIKRLLWDALTSLASAPMYQRTLFGLTILLQDEALRKALFPFTHQGPHGHLLDGTEESLSSSFWQCFEMELLMETPSVVFPTLSYLFHRLEKRFDGRPSLLILDEAWLFLDHPQFGAKIREWLKTLRKKNVSVIFATQSLSDVDRSSISHAIKESCPTRIFLPNAGALQEEAAKFYERFGLNKRQIEIIAYARPKHDYYYTSPLGNRLFCLAMDAFSLAYCGGASKERQALIRTLKNDSSDVVAFNTAFLNALNLFNEAHKFQQINSIQEAA